jgi:hypothetical protein
MRVKFEKCIGPGLINIMRLEPYFGKQVVTARIDHNTKIVYPTHGYYSKHKYAGYNKKIAIKLGYTWAE